MKRFLASLLLRLFVIPAAAQVCDGVTDDAPAIQAKLNLSGKITLPAGTCLYSGNDLVIGSNTRLLGQGRGITTLKRGGGRQIIFGGQATTQLWMELGDLIIQGNSLTATP